MFEVINSTSLLNLTLQSTDRLILEKEGTMKKLSIIRFKPKPECYDEFLENILSNSRENRTANPPTQYIMTQGDEIYGVVIRDADTLQESASKGVNWLDTQRHLLQEYNEVDRHSLPVTGNLVD